MPGEVNPLLNKIKTQEEVSAAIKAVSESEDNSTYGINIFAGLDKSSFIDMVNKSKEGNAEGSIFYKNIDTVGAENIFDSFDTNKDGVIQAEELVNCANADGNANNISGIDIKIAVFGVIGKIMEALHLQDENLEEILSDPALSQGPTGSQHYEQPSANGYSAPSDSSAGKVYSAPTTPPNPYAAMSLDQLKTEKTNAASAVTNKETEVTTAKTNLTDKQTELTSALEKFNSLEKNLAEANLAMDEAVKNDSMISAEQKTALEGINQNLATKEASIAQNATEISTKETTISTNETAIQGKRTAISEKDTAISSAESNLSSLNSQLSGISEGTTDEEKANAQSQKDGIRSKISTAKEEITRLRGERQQLEKERTELTTANDKLKAELVTLKTTKQTLETEKAELLTQKSSFGGNLLTSNCSQSTKNAITNFNTVKGEYATVQTTKATAEKAVDEAKASVDQKEAELDTEKDKLNKITEQIVKKENNTMSEELIANALKYTGKNESDGSYHLFTNGRDEAWCADFVSYVAKETYGADLPEGFGSPSVSNLQSWGEQNNRILGFDQVQPGDVMIQKNGASHTGIVTAVDPDGTIHTIEGNTSDMVAERTYPPGSSGYNKISCFIDLD